MPKQEKTSSLFFPVPFRFKVKQNETKKVVFLTSFEESVIIREHQFAVFHGGKMKYGQVLTCADPHNKGTGCPLCELAQQVEGLRTSYVRLFTVLDLSKYENKRTGVTSPYSRLILAAKGEASDRLARRSNRIEDQTEGTKNLKGAMLEIVRGGDRMSPSVGSEFEYIKHFTQWDKIKPEDRKPYPFDLFAPDMANLKRAAAMLSKAAAHKEEEYDGGYGDTSDEVEFD